MSARGGRMHDVPAGASPYPAFARSRRIFEYGWPGWLL